MSLVSNFIGGISSVGGMGVTIAPDFDLNDQTFSNILEKQLNNTVPEIDSKSEMINGLGMPAGLQIESFEGIDFSETAQDQMEALGEKINTENNTTSPFDMNGDNDVTTSEAVTFFTSLLDNSANGQNSRSELFKFAQKQVSNFYNTYSRNVITDMQEFVEDIHSMIK